MKAVVYERYGGPQVLRVQQVPAPTPAPGQVLLRVNASSINDWDYLRMTGRPLVNRGARLRAPGPTIPGADVAGVVEAFGPGTSRWQVGDAVMGDLSGAGFGAFAEYVAAPESALAPLPSRLTPEQAAAVPQAGLLAMTALRRSRPLRPGQRVLVNGAGGGVGTFAVQLARHAGAEVWAVDRADKLGRLHLLRPDRLVDYEMEDVFASGETFDHIVDIAAHHRSVRTYRRMLRPGGVCGVTGGGLTTVVWVMAAGPVRSLVGSRRVAVPMWRANDPAQTATLTRLLEQGAVVPVVDSVVGLDDVADGFRRFAAQQHVGKIVVNVARGGG
jgi:NADPH:quinone reductase-like Zn-dependent oxidoreductase